MVFQGALYCLLVGCLGVEGWLLRLSWWLHGCSNWLLWYSGCL